ncbi:MAG: Fur family transcriptional regulator, ferric uptake regulator [Mycobacteriales bacterium]
MRRSATAGRGAVSADEAAARALRAAGLAVTAPRRAVYQVLAGRERALSAGDVFDVLHAGGSKQGLTSVYRVLHAFVVSGLVHVFAGDEQRYRICRRTPHAHLICEHCGRVVERPAEMARRWLAPVAHEADFVPNVERSDLYGRCGRCGPAAVRPPIGGAAGGRSPPGRTARASAG